MIRLNLGCGHGPMPGWLNIDKFDKPGVDRVLDLDIPLPLWPFKNATVDSIRASALLEHLWHWERLVSDCARVLIPGGTLDIRVPAGPARVPYHVRFFDWDTFAPYLSDFKIRALDLRKVHHTYGSCEYDGMEWFILKDRSTEYYYPFSWHLAQRVGEWAYKLPLKKASIYRFILCRNSNRWLDNGAPP